MPIEFRILGPLELSADGRVLPLGSPKQRALLALLLLHANETVSRDRLIEELWAEAAPASVESAFHVYLSRLRRLLDSAGGGAQLVRQAHGYSLRVEPDRLDATRFQGLAGEGSEALAAGKAERAADRLRQALALWRGPALADLQSERFAIAAAARLEEGRVAALEQRFEADLALGRDQELIGELETLVAEHPYQERLRAQLMLALYRSGRQAEALQVYQQARHSLVDELGIEPGQALQRLERAILQQAGSLDLPGEPGPDDEVATPESPVETLRRPERLSGAVTFLFTDIEGSTRLVKQLRDRWGPAVADHKRILRAAFAAHRGQEIDTHGDAFFVAFGTARDAVVAAAEGQRALAGHVWPGRADVRVRMGIHSGQAALSEDRYLGLSVHRAARICAVAHGGQVLVSQTTVNLLEDEEEELRGIELRHLGEQQLKDLDRPVRLFQLVVEGLPNEFPPLESGTDGGPHTGPRGRTRGGGDFRSGRPDPQGGVGLLRGVAPSAEDDFESGLQSPADQSADPVNAAGGP